MRISVYKEAEASYLIYTEDLSIFYKKWYRPN